MEHIKENLHIYILSIVIIFSGLFIGGTYFYSQNSYIESSDSSLGSSKFFYPEGVQVATSGVIALHGFDIRVLASSTNEDRVAMFFCNPNATADIYLSMTADAPITDSNSGGFYLKDSECILFDRNIRYLGAVHASSTEADSTLSVTEFKY